MKRDFLSWEYALLVLVIAAALALVVKIKNTDIDFCRSVFNGLAQGKVSVERFIDWQNLKALDKDIGADYRGLPDENQRLAYRRAFIRSFAMGFRQGGARPGNFTHWRPYSRDSNKIIVAADHLGRDRTVIKTILFTVSLYPERKLISLQGYFGAGKK